MFRSPPCQERSLPRKIKHLALALMPAATSFGPLPPALLCMRSGRLVYEISHAQVAIATPAHASPTLMALRIAFLSPLPRGLPLRCMRLHYQASDPMLYIIYDHGLPCLDEEFKEAHDWIEHPLDLTQDVDVDLFECTSRVSDNIAPGTLPFFKNGTKHCDLRVCCRASRGCRVQTTSRLQDNKR